MHEIKEIWDKMGVDECCDINFTQDMAKNVFFGQNPGNGGLESETLGNLKIWEYFDFVKRFPSRRF